MSNLLSQASLVMIPSGYKEDVVYSQIPTNGNGDLSFTRASNGTRINSAGLVEVCPWNLIQNSENFSAIWTAQNSTITTNSLVAPNGTTTADSLIGSNGSGAMGVYVAETTSVVKTLSCYVKKGSKRWAAFIAYNGNSNCWFDLDNGVVGTRGANYSASSITSVGNGWYRIDAVMTAAIGADTNIGIYASNNDNDLNCTGDGTTVLSYIWGFQLNIGSTAKPYFPTTDRLNVPRLTYQNGGGGCPSLLLEKQSTNLFYPSDDFSGGSQNLITLTANTTETLDPSGQNTADKFIVTTSGGDAFNRIGRSIAIQNFSLSVYLKATAGQKFQLFLARDSYAQVIDTNVLTTGEWQRVVVSGSFSTTSTDVVLGFEFGYTSDDSVANQIYYLWGAQLEASSYPTSYIPTTSSSATRVADACFKTGISSLIGSTTGSVFVDFEIFTTSEFGGIIEIINTSSTGQRLLLWENASTSLELNISGGIGGGSIRTTATIGRHKAVFTYTASAIKFFLDGVKIGQTTPSTLTGGFDKLDFEHSQGGVFIQKKNINQALVSKSAFTEAEAIALTTL